MVNKETKHIEQASKPGYDKNDMQCFKDIVHQRRGVMVCEDRVERGNMGTRGFLGTREQGEQGEQGDFWEQVNNGNRGIFGNKGTRGFLEQGDFGIWRD